MLFKELFIHELYQVFYSNNSYFPQLSSMCAISFNASIAARPTYHSPT